MVITGMRPAQVLSDRQATVASSAPQSAMILFPDDVADHEDRSRVQKTRRGVPGPRPAAA